MTVGLELTRSQILAFRRHVASLNERLPHGRRALRLAAWAGLQDSMPRAALLSIHARMASTKPGSWEDPSLVQIWGPRSVPMWWRNAIWRSLPWAGCQMNLHP